MSNDDDFIPFMVYTYGYFIDGSFYVKYFKLQKAFKLYLLYVVLWMHSCMDLFKVSSSPDKKEEPTKEEVEEGGGGGYSSVPTCMYIFVYMLCIMC